MCPGASVVFTSVGLADLDLDKSFNAFIERVLDVSSGYANAEIKILKFLSGKMFMMTESVVEPHQYLLILPPFLNIRNISLLKDFIKGLHTE